MTTRCPYCDFQAQTVIDEVAHMNDVHGDVIDARLRAAGIEPEQRYDVEIRRYGAVGVLELETSIRAVPMSDVEGAVRLNLYTLGPGDTFDFRVIRRETP